MPSKKRERQKQLKSGAEPVRNPAEENQSFLHAREMVNSLGDYHSSLNKIDNSEIILKTTAAKVREIIKFKVVSFYLVDERDSSFYQAYCDPGEYSQFMEKEVNVLINDKTFALALRTNRATIITAADNSEQIMLYPLFTSSRTRGMFLGVLVEDRKNISDMALIIFSAAIIANAYALESFGLYRHIKDINKELEANIIKLEATEKELIKTNQELQQDILTRRQTEEALKKSEAYFRAITENSNDVLFILDEKGKITYCSFSVEHVLGYKASDLIGMYPHDFIVPEEQADAIKDFASALQTKAIIIPNSFRVRHKNGNILIMEGIGKNLLHDPAISGFVVNVRDATNRRLAEEQLRDSENKLQTIFNQIDTGIMIIDSATQTILEVNQKAVEMTGLSREMIIGHICHSLVCPAEAGKCPVKNLCQQIDQSERILLHADGTKKDILKTVHPITMKGREYYLESFIDISENKRMQREQQRLEQQLSQAQKMEAIGTLAGGIAHDFNNILSSIMGYTELSLSAVQDRPKVHKFMSQVLVAADRAKDLVRQILAFSRKTELEKKPLILAPVVKEVVKFIRASLPATIQIRQKIDDTTGAIMADATQMHQVLMNLCTNSGHAMRENGGILEVELKEIVMHAEDHLLYPNLKPGTYLDLSVRDTGHGISQENITKIFDPYYTTKKEGEGTGLGLAVVHGIVKDHGGEVFVYSEENKGTIFRIFLPMIEKQTEVKIYSEEDVPQGKGEMILFIDDEKPIADMSRDLLESLNYRTVAETDPVRALEIFSKNSRDFDIVITDKTMPQLTGFDVIREIKNIRKDIPVILCSGFQEKNDIEYIKTFTHTKLLIKPARINVLAKVIRDLLDEDG